MLPQEGVYCPQNTVAEAEHAPVWQGLHSSRDIGSLTIKHALKFSANALPADLGAKGNPHLQAEGRR